MGITSYLKVVKNDSESKPILKIIKEATHCLILEKEIPYYYFTSLLYKKGADDYRNYIGFKKVYNIINNYYFKNGRNIELENKLLFGEKLSLHGIRTPKVLGINEGRTLDVSGEKIKVNTAAELNELICKFIDSTDGKSIFIKPVDGEGGKDSFKFSYQTDNMKDKIMELFTLMENNAFIFQETVIQHESINKIYSNSINTIRVHTFYNKERDTVEIISALMRFGHGGSVVDNGSSGGFFIPVNIKNWTLNGFGRSYLNSGGKTFYEHPDTKQKLHGYKLPYGSEIEELVLKGSKLFPNEFIGWDIALTQRGPLAIEGNGSSHLIMLQMACGGIKNHPRFKNIFADYI